MEEIAWDNLGVFTYSAEEGTRAYEYEDDVTPEIKRERLHEILSLQEKISQKRLEERIGEEDDVLVESVDPLTQMYVGRSSFFAPDGVDGSVYFSSSKNIPFGSFVRVRYKRPNKHILIAEVVE